MEYLALKLPGGKSIDPVAGMPGGGINTLEKILRLLVQYLMVGAIIIALAFLIWGGIQWITSAGDKAGIDSARKKITYSIIGLVLVFLSFFIIRIIGNFFGVELIDFPG